jgi:5-formyltetrahydrofolate cyclo-ligase
MKTYLAFWCCDGLQYIEDVSSLIGEEYEAHKIQAELEGVPDDNRRQKTAKAISQMQTVAHYNPQRNYELYFFTANETITIEIIQDLFEDDPQFIVDFIRENGQPVVQKYHSKTPIIV